MRCYKGLKSFSLEGLSWNEIDDLCRKCQYTVPITLHYGNICIYFLVKSVGNMLCYKQHRECLKIKLLNAVKIILKFTDIKRAS